MMDAECVGDLVVPRAECSEPGDVGTGTMIGIPVQEVELNIDLNSILTWKKLSQFPNASSVVALVQ